MSEITSVNIKRRRGRPKIDTGFLAGNYDSRRAAVNKKYMFDGTMLLDYAGDEISDSKLLYNIDGPINEVVHKDGILEQLGRLYVQDNKRVDVFRGYKLKIDFNIEFEQFMVGIDKVA